jgi:uncharacterized membrane protein YvbJ
MAMIECSECGKAVSDKAANCPGCGAPIATDREAYGSGVDHLTTTQGTSKRLKLQSVFAVLLMIFGGCMVYVTASVDASDPSMAGAWMFFIGLVWYIATRVRIWWHHS